MITFRNGGLEAWFPGSPWTENYTVYWEDHPKGRVIQSEHRIGYITEAGDVYLTTHPTPPYQPFLGAARKVATLGPEDLAKVWRK